MGGLRPLTTLLFNTSYMTYYWSAIVSNTLSCTTFKLSDVEYLYRDPEICVSGHSKSLKMIPFESLGTVSYLHSIVTMVVSVSFPT